MIYQAIRDFTGSTLTGVLLASFTSCGQVPAEVPYPTPRTTGFSVTCPSGDWVGGVCPDFLPSKNPPVYQSDSSPIPERGSGRFYGGITEL